MSTPFIGILETIPYITEVLEYIQQSEKPVAMIDLKHNLSHIPETDIVTGVRYAATKELCHHIRVVDTRRSALVTGYGPLTAHGKRLLATAVKQIENRE